MGGLLAARAEHRQDERDIEIDRLRDALKGSLAICNVSRSIIRDKNKKIEALNISNVMLNTQLTRAKDLLMAVERDRVHAGCFYFMSTAHTYLEIDQFLKEGV
jgi:hypothetical protein